jgi:serine/threonine-protein kinase
VSEPPSDESDARRSVLQLITAQIGTAPRVSLSESGSEHGASPLVAPAGVGKLVPQGRDKYQLAGEIARGGMGVILKGFDTDLGRDVALKVLDGELAKNPAVVQRFVEEAQIGGQLQHPGIVPVYELGLMSDDAPFFTMKLVKGRTLAALLKQRKSLGDNRGKLLAIFEAVCQTMAYAHSKGVLHRDLKPANIMVGAFGEVQVVDWGLAKVLHRGGVADEKRARETVHTVIETVRSGPGSSGSDSLVGSFGEVQVVDWGQAKVLRSDGIDDEVARPPKESE